MRFAALFLPLLTALPALAAIDIAYDTAQRSWKLSNEKVAFSFQLTQAGDFVWRGVTDLTSGRLWKPPAWPVTAPFAFTTGPDVFPSAPVGLTFGLDEVGIDTPLPQYAVYSATTGWRLVSQTQRDVPRGARRLTIVLEDFPRTARVTLELELYPDQAALRYRASFRNLMPSRVKVVKADFL